MDITWQSTVYLTHYFSEVPPVYLTYEVWCVLPESLGRDSIATPRTILAEPSIPRMSMSMSMINATHKNLPGSVAKWYSTRCEQ